MSAMSWLLFVAFGAACFAVGWVSATSRREVADDRAEQAHDARWDAAYRSGTLVASPSMAGGAEPLSGALTAAEAPVNDRKPAPSN